MCGRALCVACAVPVRGSLLGRECLSSVLRDVPPPAPQQQPARPLGGSLALVGFALVVAASLFPWSKFGGSARAFGAWRVQGSLAAALAGVVGTGVAVLARLRPFDPRLEAAAYGALAIVAGLGSNAGHRHPPLLSVATHWPLLGVAGAAIALVGAVAMAASLLGLGRATRKRRTRPVS